MSIEGTCSNRYTQSINEMLGKNNHLFSTTQTKTVEDMDNEGKDDHYEDSGEDKKIVCALWPW